MSSAKQPRPSFSGVRNWLFVGILCLFLLLVHVWLLSRGEMDAQMDWYLLIGLFWEGISELKFWQFYTYAFFHANWLHLITNTVFLILLAWRASSIIPVRALVSVTVFGLLAGGLLHILTDWIAIAQGYSAVHLVGFSGACFAILFAISAFAPSERIWGVSLRWGNLAIGVFIMELILLLITPSLGIPWLASFGEVLARSVSEELFRINHACHVGGGVVGWFCGRYLKMQVGSFQ